MEKPIRQEGARESEKKARKSAILARSQQASKRGVQGPPGKKRGSKYLLKAL